MECVKRSAHTQLGTGIVAGKDSRDLDGNQTTIVSPLVHSRALPTKGRCGGYVIEAWNEN